MTGKLSAQSKKRDALIDILLRASEIVSGISGCRAYIVNEDIKDETTVWVFEIWDTKESHDASLKDERVRSLIAEAMPLMEGAPEGFELQVRGGYGIEQIK